MERKKIKIHKNYIAIYFLSGCLSLIQAKLFASSINKDSTLRTKPWKISKQQFLEKYGKDDTAKDIINYFFWLQVKAHRRIIPSSLVLGGSIFLTAITAKSLAILGIGFFSIPLMLISAVFLFKSWDNFSEFSRKKLLRILNNYFAGNGIPSRIKKILNKEKKWH